MKIPSSQSQFLDLLLIMHFASTVAGYSFPCGALSAAIDSRQHNEYKLRVSRSEYPSSTSFMLPLIFFSGGAPIQDVYLSIRNSKVGIFPGISPLLAYAEPSSSDPDHYSLITISDTGIHRAVALVGTYGLLDLLEIDLPSENTPERSWEDWVVEFDGENEVLQWGAATLKKDRPWLAMPESQGRDGYLVWYVDDFEGGMGGVTLPIYDIILERSD